MIDFRDVAQCCVGEIRDALQELTASTNRVMMLERQ
jgi:hypothetical protein